MLNVDPAGDRPIVDVTYPSLDAQGNKQTLGGIIRITGSADVKASGTQIQGVYIQIDPNYNGTDFDENWESALDTMFTSGGKTYANAEYSVEEFENPETGAKMHGIRTKGTVQSWNLTINKINEFDIANANRDIAIRVYAITGGKISSPVTVPFTIDANSPKIGSTEPLYLVQYENGASSGTVVSKQEYKEGMWISGQWYLTGSVEDDSGIQSIKLNGESINANYITPIANIGSYHNYRLNVPVGESNSGVFGQKVYTIVATEGVSNSGQVLTAEQKVIINYDNKAPVFGVTSMAASGNKIQNTNYGYVMDGTFEETGDGTSNQSGFSRVVFYLTRGSGDQMKLVDPMLNQGTTGDSNRELASGYKKLYKGL